MLLPFVFLSGDVRTPGEFALQYAMALMIVAAGAAFCYYFARGNYLAYVVVFWVAALTGPLGELYGNTRPPYFWGLLGMLITGLLWAFLPVRRAADVAPNLETLR